ncbi:hypothetical protein [Paraburkholderia terrae]|uniref:hypothetical protein n=1 Tax=Paraburkholderia terrae TaxID=311230 RepID=UPI0020C063EE|nr:hypothetical protein [Paraburkholderia terrae]
MIAQEVPHLAYDIDQLNAVWKSSMQMFALFAENAVASNEPRLHAMQQRHPSRWRASGPSQRDRYLLRKSSAGYCPFIDDGPGGNGDVTSGPNGSLRGSEIGFVECQL